MVIRMLNMPRLGETMDEGRIAGWLKRPGEEFARGEAILEIETDKTVAEFPALQAGRLVEILCEEGEMVAVGEPIARIEVDATDADRSRPAPGQGGDRPSAAPAAPSAPPAPARPEGGPLRATPLARRLARQHGVDLGALAGRGPRGRIEKEDVLAAATATTAGAADGAGAVADTAPPPSFADLPQGRMAFATLGPADGPVVLLLHGFAGDHTTWAATATGLARAGHRVLVPDLPGHGATGIEAATPADLGAPLADFLSALGIGGRIDVVAHSLGATAAVALARAMPGRIASLTLLAPVGLGLEIDSTFLRGMAAASSPGEVAHLLRRVALREQALSVAALDRFAAEAGRGRLKALTGHILGPGGQRVDLLPALGEFTQRMPVRVAFGLQDRIIPWQQVTALPPAVAIHLIAASGHMPHWDRPREVAALLGRWLGDGTG